MKYKSIIVCTLVLFASVCWLLWPRDPLTQEVIAKVNKATTLKQIKSLLGEPLTKANYHLEQLTDCEQGCEPAFVGFVLDPKRIDLPKKKAPATFKPFLEMYSVSMAHPHYLWLGRDKLLWVIVNDEEVVQRVTLVATEDLSVGLYRRLKQLSEFLFN